MSIDRGIDRDVEHIYNGILLSHKKDKIMPFSATWMQLKTLILSEVSQKEKDKYHMISLISGIKYMAQTNLSTEKKLRDMENRLVVANWEAEANRCKPLHLEWISNEILLCSTGNSV